MNVARYDPEQAKLLPHEWAYVHPLASTTAALTVSTPLSIIFGPDWLWITMVSMALLWLCVLVGFIMPVDFARRMRRTRLDRRYKAIRSRPTRLRKTRVFAEPVGEYVRITVYKRENGWLCSPAAISNTFNAESQDGTERAHEFVELHTRPATAMHSDDAIALAASINKSAR